MEDIAPALLEQLQSLFAQNLGARPRAAQLLDKIKTGGAGYADAGDYAEEVGRALADAFATLTGEALPDGRMYWNIADRVIRPLLETDHNLVTEAAVQVQRSLNTAAGLGLNPQAAPLNTDRVDGLLNRLAAAPQFADVAWLLQEPVITFSRSAVDETLQTNVDFQGKAGLRPKVVRRTARKCCAWCSNLAGSYTYPDVPKDVYRRHENCRCVVEYDPGSGRRQNVHTKAWTNTGGRGTIKTENAPNTGADTRTVRILRGTGGMLGEEGSTVHKFLGTIDPADTEAMNALTDTFCRQYAGLSYESMLVVTREGEVHFVTDHAPAGVDCTYLGDKLRGSYNIHTHPPETTQFSFSTDVDLPAFFADGSAVMEAVDYKYRYRFERPEGLTFEAWEAVRSQVEEDKGNVLQARGLTFADYEENMRHVIIDETCRRLGLNIYSREKWP